MEGTMKAEQVRVNMRVKRLFDYRGKGGGKEYRYGFITRVHKTDWGTTLITVKREGAQSSTWACDFWEPAEPMDEW